MTSQRLLVELVVFPMKQEDQSDGHDDGGRSGALSH